MLLSNTTLSLITNFNYENVIKIVTNTLSSFTYVYSFLIDNNNKHIKKYLDDIDTMDVKVKLEFMYNWLSDNNDVKETYESDIILITRIKEKKSSNFNLLFFKIREIAEIINNNIIMIEKKIKNHVNTWNSYIFSIDLKNEITMLKKHVKILDSRIQLIKVVL